ncbi:isocitrate/isopropylmalate family dehydrogenase [Lutimaribacter marinistellae]|uniref:Isocitrate/isopropylmalate family dehydrogenase n=1 Tax=Lutimaribacter marinistellae TaxID=1820329 RepID=A0ABV7TFQ2_9RHOB
MEKRLLALGGDGIGPEIPSYGLRVTEHLAARSGIELSITQGLLHGAAWEAHGTFCTSDVLQQARASDAIPVGAAGGPKWDHIRVPDGVRCQDGLMYLRRHLQTYLGLRPACAWPALLDRTPFRTGAAAHADILTLREMCGGGIFATERGRRRVGGLRQGYDMTAYDKAEVSRFSHGAFELAKRRRGRLVSCDKSNVMESYKLWREVVTKVAQDYPEIAFQNMFADNCAYQLMMRPHDFDVVIGCNQMGDVLSDLTAVFAGSLGMLPSACLAANPDSGSALGIYERAAGSGPDITGLGIANPVGTILSVGMMFTYSFAMHEVESRIQTAVAATLQDGIMTPDLGDSASGAEMTEAIIDRLGP